MGLDIGVQLRLGYCTLEAVLLLKLIDWLSVMHLGVVLVGRQATAVKQPAPSLSHSGEPASSG